MMGARVYLAAEDSVGLALGRRLIREQSSLEIFRDFNGQGFGRLRADARRFDTMAKNGIPVVLLIDLDRQSCPIGLLEDWLGKNHVLNQNFLLRVCVREAEAWVMADTEAVARFLGIPCGRLSSQPEDLSDPKHEFLRLAAQSTRNIRNGLLPKGRSKALVGPEYNRHLESFIREHWSPDAAGLRAPSLQSARQRISELSRRC